MYAKDNKGATAMHFAALQGFPYIVEHILNCGMGPVKHITPTVGPRRTSLQFVNVHSIDLAAVAARLTMDRPRTCAQNW